MRAVLGLCLLSAMTTNALADMTVAFEWGPTKQCFDTRSPPMHVSGAPGGTASLDIRMADLNSDYVHGGGKVGFKGQGALPYGAFRYKGPCPPDGPHTYVFTVKALDAQGKTLATAKATRKFPEK